VAEALQMGQRNRQALASEKIGVEKEFPAQLPLIWVTAHDCSRLVLNLVSNFAIKFTTKDR